MDYLAFNTRPRPSQQETFQASMATQRRDLSSFPEGNWEKNIRTRLENYQVPEDLSSGHLRELVRDIGVRQG